MRWAMSALLAIGIAVMLGCGGGTSGGGVVPPIPGLGSIFYSSMAVFGFNDLGMHCMNDDFSKLMILPPFNNLRAVVVARSGEDPEIRTTGVTVRYRIPSNTTSVNKTNFWTYVNALLGVNPAPDYGLTGETLAGNMKPTANPWWEASGIPITPILDNNTEDPYPLAEVSVTSGGQTVARTQVVVPVSWEMNCDLCHTGAASWEDDVLADHDRLHQTDLQGSTPEACGTCHAQPPLAPITGPGQAGVPSLSSAMHSAHTSRMDQINLAVSCYACHPGIRTDCLRGVHSARGLDCLDCHGGMAAVGNPARAPWSDLPRCQTCHAARRPNFEFEQAGKLFTQSLGHQGVPCQACHGSPHAITPTVTPRDNRQAIGLQGHAGVIDDCTICHTQRPDETFPHRRDDGD